MSRQKRGLLLSVLRAQLFNTLLADRVVQGVWNRVLVGDTCILQGTRSQFHCAQPDEEIHRRCRSGDLHPALPLWGRGMEGRGDQLVLHWRDVLSAQWDRCEFLLHQDVDCGWRPARLIPDDFCWDFCDDGSLQLDFRLGAGCYATALLAEFVRYIELRA
jgi:tRNA pseudouridine13 synthase